MAKRKLRSFLEGYDEYVQPFNTPLSWRQWSGLWAISAAVERRVFCYTKGKPMYPNLFVFLIGRSGGGKTLAVETLYELINNVGPNRLSASSMTSAYLAEAIKNGERKYVNPISNKGEPFHSLNILSTELQVLFPVYDVDMMAKITDMYDCNHYSEGRRAKDNSFVADRTCMTMLAATTMTHVLSTFPETIWGTGFMSRVILVYDEPPPRRSLFEAEGMTKERMKLLEALKHDIKIISQKSGELKFEKEAAEKLDAFYMYESDGGVQLGGPPIPDHPNLLTYCERRHANIEKVMMDYALDEDSEVLTVEHYERAYEFLINTEAVMPEIFKAEVAGSDIQHANDLLYKMSTKYAKKKQPITHGAMVGQLINKTNYYQANGIIKMLEEARKIKKISAEERKTAGLPIGDYYVPLAVSFNEDKEL